MIRLGVLGASGRMGRATVAAAERDPGIAEIVPVSRGDDVAAKLHGLDAAIDFSLPPAIPKHAAGCAAAGCAWVVGVTALDEPARRAIDAAAKRIPVLWAPNMSLGVNLCLDLVERAAAALGSRFSVKIHERHHVHKLDKPSGTALELGRRVARGFGLDPDAVDGDGLTHDARRLIEFESVREGEVPGEHRVAFTGSGQTIELTHRAHDREGFADGALAAARWLAGRQAGRYSFRDFLTTR